MGAKYCIFHLTTASLLTGDRIAEWVPAAFRLAGLGTPISLMEQTSDNERTVEYNVSALYDAVRRDSIISVYPINGSSARGGVQLFSSGSVNVAEVFLPSVPPDSVTVSLHTLSSIIGAFVTAAGVEISVPTVLTRDGVLAWAFNEAEIVCTSKIVAEVGAGAPWVCSRDGNTNVFRRAT